MKRLAFVLITGILLVSLSESCWADAGFWAGAKGVYFHPLNSYLNQWYRPFWGLGGEGGWVLKRHLEFGVEVSYAMARSKEDVIHYDYTGNAVGTLHDEVSNLAVSSKVAYRVLGQRTPYFGIGVGFYRAAWKLVGQPGGSGYPFSEAKTAIGTVLFTGYDWRLNRHFGLRAEGGVQIAKVKNWPGEGDMGGQKASLGAYVAW